ncbi:MAG TPA: hypothetical protein VGJ26_18285 [Pirellulales bacterium]
MSNCSTADDADALPETSDIERTSATKDQVPSAPREMPLEILLGLVALAFAVPLIYALFTDHIWEDSFITLRISENLLKGKGLTFNPPELVHGFTSPINVLLLAACSYVAGQTSYEATFWLYRIFCAAAFAGGMALLARRIWSATPAHPKVCVLAFALLYIFDLKMVAFTANGMETAFMLLFFAGAMSELVRDDPAPWIARGLFWAGMMWTRPDGCVYIAGMALADLYFSPGLRRELLVSFIKSGLLSAVIYAPWIAWATWYYGSPIPHTVIAKANVEIGPLGQVMQAFDGLFEIFVSRANAAFLPIYDVGGYFDGKHRIFLWTLYGLSRVVSLFCCIYWIFPVNDRLGRAASLTFVVGMLYLTPMGTPVFPWYLAFAALPGLVTLTRGIVTLSDVALRLRGKNVAGELHLAAEIALVTLVGWQMVMCGINAWEMRVQQAEIELGNRREIGLWLREHGWPQETVLLEPLGYIGYFSKMHMLDWPGLVTPEMVAARKKVGGGMPSMIGELKPDWVLLRPAEYGRLGTLRDQFDKDYVPEHVFDARERLNQYKFIPGKPYVFVDATFFLFRRRDLRPSSFPQPVSSDRPVQPAPQEAK